MTEYGHITMSPRDDIVAGSMVTLTFTYTVGERGMREGGSLRIATPNDAWGWPLVPLHRYFQQGHLNQGRDGGYTSYARMNTQVELESDSEAWLDLAAEERCPIGDLRGGWAHHIVARVRDGDLQPGDVIRIIYGDTTWGEDGVEAQRVAPTPKDHFHAYVDVGGELQFVELPADELAVNVVPTPPAKFRVVGPSVVRPGEEFEVRVAAIDEFNTRPSGAFTGEVRVGSRDPRMQIPGSAAFTEAESNHHRIEGAMAHAEGLHRVSVERAEGRGGRDHSNPIWCVGREMRVYFGDLHCQTMYHSDSIGTPDEAYEFGRDMALLDFMGVTDSGGQLKDGWIETQEATNRHYEPGRFVTFKGFEYGGQRGHRNVIYRQCEIEPPLEDLESDNPEALFDYFRGRDDIISIPHHTKVWTDWDYYDQELERLVEVYSCWGSGVEHNDPLWEKSEKPGAGVFNALARGYRFGFIGCGDSHAGMPGRSYPQDRQWCVHRKSGYTGVWAPELTREAIFDGLYNRRVYATTGVRMILEFSVNDEMMGGEIDLDDASEERVIRIHAIGERPIAYMRIVRSNETLFVRECSREEEYFEFRDTDPAEDGDFYYVRVVQEDEETGWSSPVWVNV